MFCPGCGSEDQHTSQFCRACGTDLRTVRMGLERPDSITASAVTAREEIGRAIADRIREVQDANELKKVAEDVLPEVEKFLESPEEKRMRRIRTGIIIAAAGFGSAILGLILSEALTDPHKAALVGGLGLIAFVLGIGFVLNGLIFTKPRARVEDRSSAEGEQNQLDERYAPPQLKAQTTSNLTQTPGSVTEHTTLHLKSDR